MLWQPYSLCVKGLLYSLPVLPNYSLTAQSNGSAGRGVSLGRGGVRRDAAWESLDLTALGLGTYRRAPRGRFFFFFVCDEAKGPGMTLSDFSSHTRGTGSNLTPQYCWALHPTFTSSLTQMLTIDLSWTLWTWRRGNEWHGIMLTMMMMMINTVLVMPCLFHSLFLPLHSTPTPHTPTSVCVCVCGIVCI